DVEAFLRSIGIDAVSVSPTMTHQYMLVVPEDMTGAVVDKLSGVRLGGGPVFGVDARKPGHVYFGCAVHRPVAIDETVDGLGSNENVRFLDAFYRIDGMKSGSHHPDGALWIRSGRFFEHDQKVSILDVFPTLVHLTGCDADWKTLPTGEARPGQVLPVH
ncbi:MAG: hypothetical protein LPL00_09565, partial [Alphaproteobacteria bacterium]|nr:hypothetical protein [Alphaproteobacteria bacterium]MDX5369880.1 hypothetical protein [Alphaproteobacteria bacterium]MDX5464494.1 hypothetical protein [Alphaproteobacteria bacterium]